MRGEAGDGKTEPGKPQDAQVQVYILKDSLGQENQSDCRPIWMMASSCEEALLLINRLPRGRFLKRTCTLTITLSHD